MKLYKYRTRLTPFAALGVLALAVLALHVVGVMD